MYYNGDKILKNVVNPTRTGIQPFTTKTIKIPLYDEVQDYGWLPRAIKEIFEDFDDVDFSNDIKPRIVKKNKRIVYTDDYYLSMDGNLFYNVYTNEKDGKVKFLIEFKVPQKISTKEELKERLKLKLKNKNEILIKIQKDDIEDKNNKEEESKFKKTVESFDTTIKEDLKMDIVQFKKKTKTDYEKTQEIHDVKFVGFEKGIMKVEFEIGSSDEIVDIEI